MILPAKFNKIDKHSNDFFKNNQYLHKFLYLIN